MAKYTNKFKLPDRVLRILPPDYPPHSDPYRISTTDLIEEPRIRTLYRERYEDLVIDYADKGKLMFGVAGHAYAESFVEDDESSERKLEYPIDGWTLVAKSDNFNINTGQLLDAKWTTISQVQSKDTRLKWTKQLNVYAAVWREMGFDVTSLTIDAYMLDWKPMKAKWTPGYPKVWYKETVIPLWDHDKAMQYIRDQLHYHRMSPLNECSDENKWLKPATFKIYKKGQKKAMVASVDGKPIESKEHAEKIIQEKGLTEEYESGKIYITEVDSLGPLRCKEFCKVRSTCEFAKGLK